MIERKQEKNTTKEQDPNVEDKTADENESQGENDRDRTF